MVPQQEPAPLPGVTIIQTDVTPPFWAAGHHLVPETVQSGQPAIAFGRVPQDRRSRTWYGRLPGRGIDLADPRTPRIRGAVGEFAVDPYSGRVDRVQGATAIVAPAISPEAVQLHIARRARLQSSTGLKCRIHRAPARVPDAGELGRARATEHGNHVARGVRHDHRVEVVRAGRAICLIEGNRWPGDIDAQEAST